jgi:hypothetical protein
MLTPKHILATHLGRTAQLAMTMWTCGGYHELYAGDPHTVVLAAEAAMVLISTLAAPDAKNATYGTPTCASRHVNAEHVAADVFIAEGCCMCAVVCTCIHVHVDSLLEKPCTCMASCTDRKLACWLMHGGAVCALGRRA